MTCAQCISYRRIIRGGTIFKVFCKRYPETAHMAKCIYFIAKSK
jgi:hypothetical protein